VTIWLNSLRLRRMAYKVEQYCVSNMSKYWAAIIQQLKRATAYRVDFWLRMFSSTLLQVGIAYALWSSIFEASGRTTIEGFTLSGMVTYYILAAGFDRIARGNEDHELSQEIYEGALTRYLLFPVRFFRYKFAFRIADTFIHTLQSLIVLLPLYFFVSASEFSVSLSQVSLAVLFILLAVLNEYLIASCLQLVAFWADNVWSLMVIHRFFISFLGGTFIPLSLFPAWAQQAIEYLPFWTFVSAPVKILMGDVSEGLIIKALFVSLCWLAVNSFILNLVWRRGRLIYTGVGI